MGQLRHHYERAFEAFLRQQSAAYLRVDEAKKALLGPGEPLRLTRVGPDGRAVEGPAPRLKTFDFVIYSSPGAGPGPGGGPGPGAHLLVEVKGRRVPVRRAAVLDDGAGRGRAGRVGAGRGGDPVLFAEPAGARRECWVTMDDVESLRNWGELFGAGFVAAFVFLYASEEPPANALFEEHFEHAGRWYGVRVIPVETYAATMRVRSPRWRTVDLAAADFDRLSGPLFAAGPAGARAAAGAGAGTMEAGGWRAGGGPVSMEA